MVSWKIIIDFCLLERPLNMVCQYPFLVFRHLAFHRVNCYFFYDIRTCLPLSAGIPRMVWPLIVKSSKYVLMNGGKQEVGAAVNMVFRKDIWGGIIQSIHGSYIIVLRTHSFPIVYGIPVHTFYLSFFSV